MSYLWSTDESRTPLFYAAINYRIDATKLLLESGADPMCELRGRSTVFRSIVRRICKWIQIENTWVCRPDDQVMILLLKHRDPKTGEPCGHLSPPKEWLLHIYDYEGSNEY